jgi:hypothetical protein
VSVGAPLSRTDSRRAVAAAPVVALREIVDATTSLLRNATPVATRLI